jgi:hypothetical protein
MSENIGHATPPILAKYVFTATTSRDSIGIQTLSKQTGICYCFRYLDDESCLLASGVTIAHLSPGIQKEKAIKRKG